uniref:Uncharacterized protein n=1 Tax=Rhizophora mucronata TaxID=61149 RepID=A0A2P2R0K0_RHIMU
MLFTFQITPFGHSLKILSFLKGNELN